MVRSVFGENEPLSDYTVVRNDETDSFKSITVNITKTETNQHGFDLVTNLNYLEYEGDVYVISLPRKSIKGNTVTKQVTTIHKPVWDLEGKRVRETITGHIRPRAMLEFILKGSGFTFELDDEGFETSVEVENFGSDSCKNLLTSFKDRFECELLVQENKVYAAKFFGRQTEEILKHRFNISDIIEEMDTSEFFTYIRGWGAKKENDEDAPIEYEVEDDHVSDLAKIYGIREAPWVDDERYYHQPALHQRLIRELNDSLNVSITLTAKQMDEMDLSGIRKGDWVWCFIDPFDIDVRIRVVAVQDTEDPKKDPVFTLGTIKKKMTKRMARYENTQNVVSKVIDERTGRIRDGAINTANMTLDLGKAKGKLDSSKIENLIIPSYDRASVNSDGLMASEDFTKLSRITVDQQGNISVPPADAFRAGLLSAADFIKLQQIQVNPSSGLVNLTEMINKIETLEQKVKVLEGGDRIE